jgi:preprotein translocase subunit SecD
MSTRGTWRLAVAIILLALAVIFTLDLDFPQWVEGLLLWRLEGQRALDIPYGADMQGSLQVRLEPSLGYQADAAAVQSARQTIEDRIAGIEPTDPLIQVLGESSLVVELPGVRGRTWLTDTAQSIGLVEFIDASLRYAWPGTVVETNLGPTGEPKTEDTLSPGTLVTPTVSAEATDVVYDTVLSSDDLLAVRLDDAGEGEYVIAFWVAPSAQADFAAFTGAHAGDHLCVAVDKLVLACAGLPDQPLREVASIPGVRLAEEEQATRLQMLLASGPLPVPLEIRRTTALGPTLGEATVRLLASATGLGLAALALFLAVHYRLAGLVANVVLLAFGLASFALCRLIPVTVTIPSLAGLLIAGAVALGSVCTTLERLREQKRARGLITFRSIGDGFSAAWPVVRIVHLTLLALAAALWYVGLAAEASPVRALGLALVTGLVASLFAARMLAMEFAYLTLGSAREPLRRSAWLLGV